MDTAHHLALEEARVTLAGKEYRLAPLRLRDYAEMEAFLFTSRPDPLDLVIAKLDRLPEELQKHLLSEAYEDVRRGRQISAEELDQWLATPEGRVFEFWLSIRQHHEDITLDDAETLLRQAGESGAEAIERGLAVTQGEPVGN